MKRIASVLLRISITLALLIFLFFKIEVRAIGNVLRDGDKKFMAAAFLIFLGSYFLGFLRWHFLLKGQSVRLRKRRLFETFLSSQFFNLVLPSTIGGDAVRTLEVAQHAQVHSSGILATVILDRLSGFFGLITVLVFSLLVGYHVLNDPAILLVTIILLALVAVLSAVLFSGRFFRVIFRLIPWKKVREYLSKIHEATHEFRRHKSSLLVSWLFSVVIQAGGPLIYYFCGLSLGVDLSLLRYYILVPMITAFSVIPVSIGGLGVRDAASVVAFAKVGLPAEKAFALSLMNFGFLIILGLLGGVCYVASLYRRRI